MCPPLSEDISPAGARDCMAFLHRLQRRVLLNPSLQVRRVSEGQQVRGPLTPRPGHLPLVRTGWGAPRWAACCGGALQGLEYLRVCSWGAAGLHVTVRGFLSLDWAGVPSTGSCPCSFLRHPKSQSASKLGPLTHSPGHRCVCTHVGTCVTHAYDHTCTHLDAHTCTHP